MAFLSCKHLPACLHSHDEFTVPWKILAKIP